MRNYTTSANNTHFILLTTLCGLLLLCAFSLFLIDNTSPAGNAEPTTDLLPILQNTPAPTPLEKHNMIERMNLHFEISANPLQGLSQIPLAGQALTHLQPRIGVSLLLMDAHKLIRLYLVISQKNTLMLTDNGPSLWERLMTQLSIYQRFAITHIQSYLAAPRLHMPKPDSHRNATSPQSAPLGIPSPTQLTPYLTLTKINAPLYRQLQSIFKDIIRSNPNAYPQERFGVVSDPTGQILLATLTLHHQTFKAIRYTNSDGYTGYYTPTGQALFKSIFLSAPLKYARISDNYSAHRWHPILHLRRPHYGIDYAAPEGTPIRAIGNGQISFAGQDGGYGKAVIIQHSNQYQSLYAHMSHIRYSIKPGQWVTQGQIIGYVGSTGLSTGPHLHFGLYRYGHAVNPEIVLPKSDPPTAIATRDLPDFLAKTNQLLMQLALEKNQAHLT